MFIKGFNKISTHADGGLRIFSLGLAKIELRLLQPSPSLLITFVDTKLGISESLRKITFIIGDIELRVPGTKV